VRGSGSGQSREDDDGTECEGEECDEADAARGGRLKKDAMRRSRRSGPRKRRPRAAIRASAPMVVMNQGTRQYGAAAIMSAPRRSRMPTAMRSRVFEGSGLKSSNKRVGETRATSPTRMMSAPMAATRSGMVGPPAMRDCVRGALDSTHQRLFVFPRDCWMRDGECVCG
jgi:hypothetical protein